MANLSTEELDKMETGGGLTTDQLDMMEPDPRYGSGMSPEFPDLPDFKLSKELREKTENSLYYSQQYGIPPEMAFEMESELKKQAERLDLMSDIEKAIYETPENIKIGTVGLAASTMFAIKRRAMLLSGGGLFPDEMVKHQFEPIKPMKREELPNIPGMIRPMTKDWPTGTLAEAFGLVTRLPSVAGTVIQEEQRKMAEAQDREIIKNAPITKAMRSVTQSGVPSMAAAIGIALLTNDPTVALALLGEMEGGSAFQTQLEGGASIMKANIIGDLSEAAEIGGEMLVLPKLFKGVKKGFSLRQAFTAILENTTQEGITGFNQRFLEVFGLETTKGMDAEQAAIKALNEGVKAIPENAWVGGASAGGPVMIRGGFDLAVSAVKGKGTVGAEVVAKPIATEKAAETPAKAKTPIKPITPAKVVKAPIKLAEATVTEGKVTDKIFVHETDKAFEKFDLSKAGTGQGEAWLGRGIYLNEKGSFKFERYGKNKIEAKLSPEANIFEVVNTPEDKYRDTFVKWAVENTKTGQELAEQRQKEGLSLQNLLPRDILQKNPDVVQKLRDAGYDGLYQDGELVIYNPDVLKPTPAEAKGKGEGEEKVSRLAERTQELAVEKQLTENLGDLPTYETMKMADQAKRAVEIIDKDYEQAKRIAMGKENPPQGLRAASMY